MVLDLSEYQSVSVELHKVEILCKHANEYSYLQFGWINRSADVTNTPVTELPPIEPQTVISTKHFER